MKFRYVVLEASNIIELEQAVELHGEAGWKPTGGFTVNSHGTNRTYYQPMIKYKRDFEVKTG